MDGMEYGSSGGIGDHAAWSAAPRLAGAVRTFLAPSVNRARSTDTAEHRDAITVRQLAGALPSFAVTPTLYFHADTSAAVALTVGVESVAIDPHKAATDVQSVSWVVGGRRLPMPVSPATRIAATRWHLPVVGAVLIAASMAFFAPLALAQPQDAAAAAVGTVARLAGRIGVQTCLDATRRFGPALTGTTGSHAAVVMSHPAAPDAATLGVAIERKDAQATSLVSATFAPTLRGGCDLSYDKVDVWRKSCHDVAREELRYIQALERLGEQTAVIPYSPTHHVYLIRIPGGCVSVTKEVVYP